jgi:hypothetical protein
MTGPTGFIDRYKGKTTIDAAALKVSGVSMYGALSVQSTQVLPATSVQLTAVFCRINPSSAAAVCYFPAISFIGQPLTLEIYSLSSALLVSGSAKSQTLNGSSYNTLKSTVNVTISLEATSTVNWAVVGTYSTGSYTLVLSTST